MFVYPWSVSGRHGASAGVKETAVRWSSLFRSGCQSEPRVGSLHRPGGLPTGRGGVFSLPDALGVAGACAVEQAGEGKLAAGGGVVGTVGRSLRGPPAADEGVFTSLFHGLVGPRTRGGAALGSRNS